MRIGIMGSGDVGKALARGFVSRGHEVVIGSRDPGKLESFAAEQKGVRAGSFADAVSSGEIVVLATAFDGTKSAIELVGSEAFDGKIVMDATNPIKHVEGAMPEISTAQDTSAGEEVQRWLPGAKVVKAYNIIGNGLMVDPEIAGGPPTMFICGNDEGAKKTVAQIIESFGYGGEVIDLGDITESKYLEALAMVWIHYAFKNHSYKHGFKLLR